MLYHYDLADSFSIILIIVLCMKIRVLRNFVNFKTLRSYQITWKIILVATGWALFPYKNMTKWALHLLVWCCFGPWLKLVDIFWIHHYYRTKEGELYRALH